MRGISGNVLVLGAASLLFGLLWQGFGLLAAFGCGAALAAVAALLLMAVIPGGRHPA